MPFYFFTLSPKVAQHGAGQTTMPAHGKTLRMYIKGWIRREKNNRTTYFDRGQLLDLLTVSSDITLELKLHGSLRLIESGI